VLVAFDLELTALNAEWRPSRCWQLGRCSGLSLPEINQAEAIFLKLRRAFALTRWQPAWRDDGALGARVNLMGLLTSPVFEKPWKSGHPRSSSGSG
jgi:hypothetical protein